MSREKKKKAVAVSTASSAMSPVVYANQPEGQLAEQVQISTQGAEPGSQV